MAQSHGVAWLDALDPEVRASVARTDIPQWLDPMAATLTADRFDDPQWVFEPKLDGIRYLAFVANGEATLLTRNRLRHRHPVVEAALLAQSPADFVVDGEMVRGQYHVFDILRLDGHDVRRVPLDVRKQLLRDAFVWSPPLHLIEPLEEDGVAAYERACDEGWEGVIAKRRTSAYEGRRSRDWLKMKCDASQELVVGGFTDPRGSRLGFGALLVGYYDGGDFVYAGRLGTGYDSRLLVELRARLETMEVAAAPFTRATGLPRSAHWVRPEIVVEAAFMEWTGGGKLRHPRFVRVRDDKAPREVTREAT